LRRGGDHRDRADHRDPGEDAPGRLGSASIDPRWWASSCSSPPKSSSCGADWPGAWRRPAIVRLTAVRLTAVRLTAVRLTAVLLCRVWFGAVWFCPVWFCPVWF
jgi:hypothetical protein